MLIKFKSFQGLMNPHWVSAPGSHSPRWATLEGLPPLQAPLWTRCGNKKMRPTNSVIYGTLRYTVQAIRCCASYILLNRLGLGINSEFLCD